MADSKFKWSSGSQILGTGHVNVGAFDLTVPATGTALLTPASIAFTPAFVSSGATFAHSYQVGRYCIIGPVLFFTWFAALSGAPGGTTSNGLILSGLPVASANVSRQYHAGEIAYGDVTYPGTTNSIGYEQDFNSALLSVMQYASGAAPAILTAAALTTGSYIMATGHYFIA